MISVPTTAPSLSARLCPIAMPYTLARFAEGEVTGLNAQVEFAAPQVRVYVGYVCQLRCLYSPHGDADLNQIPAGGPPKREALGRDKGRGSAHGGQCL